MLLVLSFTVGPAFGSACQSLSPVDNSVDRRLLLPIYMLHLILLISFFLVFLFGFFIGFLLFFFHSRSYLFYRSRTILTFLTILDLLLLSQLRHKLIFLFSFFCSSLLLTS